MSYMIHLSRKSSNAKTGPIPVSTTGASTCPIDCAMRAGCYASTGPLALHWRAVSDGRRGMPLEEFCAAVSAMPEGQLWRHNQAGDLPGNGRTVDPVALGALVKANKGRRGFTYTHYRDKDSLQWVRHANDLGFTVNLSANSLEDADTLADTGAGPVVTIAPSHQTQNTVTPKGRRVVICPAAIREDISCATCQLCQRAERAVIIGFPAHGTKKRIINIQLESSHA